MSVMKRLCSGLAALMLLLPLAAHSGEKWAHKKKLGFDTTPNGADLKEAVTQIPVLVRLHSGNFSFAEAKPDGSDLRFLGADDKTPLKFHIEQYDAKNELANIWIQVPKLAANTDKDALFMEWGNPDAVAAGDAKGSYDAAQIFVYHFSGSGGVKDATGNANDASESTAKPVPAGPIGEAASFDGTAHVVVPASPSLKLSAATGFTFSAWVKPAASDNGNLYVQRDGAKTLAISLVGGTLSATLDAAKAKASAPLKPGVWQHVAVVAGAGKLAFYVDGLEAGSASFALSDIGGQAVIGDGFRGDLDEVALAGTARSVDYLKVMASSQVADTPMLSFDEKEEGGEGLSYVSILLGAVTIDGWVVIGVLMVMAIVSAWVMISKTVFLARTNKANRLFLERFKDKSDHMLIPGHPETAAVASNAGMQNSSIYQLYAVGLREVTHRFETQTRAGKSHSLSLPAIDAIRAALEAAMMRQNQRINSGIVLLTIAISGGPFLGLLGTVVGVMITFAAIAAAGDVNVNAIAPGIAAALVATVAGLIVAIPALFGYNWLASQIKNISADAHVFTDEFLTKSAEIHSA